MGDTKEFTKILMRELKHIPADIADAYHVAGSTLLMQTEPKNLNVSLLNQFWTATRAAAKEVFERDIDPHKEQFIRDIGQQAFDAFMKEIWSDTFSKMSEVYMNMHVLVNPIANALSSQDVELNNREQVASNTKKTVKGTGGTDSEGTSGSETYKGAEEPHREK